MDLARFVPSAYEQCHPHYDPDPDHFTHGEPLAKSKDGKRNMRAEQLSLLGMGDYLFFVASLVLTKKTGYDDRSLSEINALQKGKRGKYVIGYFEIAGVYEAREVRGHCAIARVNNRKPHSDIEAVRSQILESAHAKRPWDEFTCAVGVKDGRKTALLSKAIPITKLGKPFRPNDTGLSLYGNLNFPRGHKWLRDQSKLDLLLDRCRLP